MLIYLILQIPLMFLNVVTSIFPSVDTLPLGLDALLVSGFGYFLYVATLIPPLMSLYNAFIWVVSFKIGLRIFLMIPIVGRMFR